MKRLITLLLITIFLVSGTWSGAQVQLPVWNVLHPCIANPQDGDTLDGRYAAMPYVEQDNWPMGMLKYSALRTVRVDDHWTLKVYAKIPRGVGFWITAMTDTGVFCVLYEYKTLPADNEEAEPVDTVLQVDDLYSYGKDFTRFAVIRRWTPRQTYDTMYVDAITLTMHEKSDTIVTSHDDTIIVTPPEDTIPSSVKVNYENPKVTFDNMPPVDLLGRPVSDTTKSGVYFIRGRKKVVTE